MHDLGSAHTGDLLDALCDKVHRPDAIANSELKNGAGTKLPQQLDMTQVIKQAIAATAEETKGCTVDVQLAPALPALSGDAPALQRAVQNLIVNAAKHGGKGGWIGVTGVIDEDVEPAVVEVQIADRGHGIPHGELASIFKPFYRGAAAEADQVRGSGLGLTLVKEIVEAHGGAISVASQPGRGTTFTIRVPALKGKEAA